MNRRRLLQCGAAGVAGTAWSPARGAAPPRIAALVTEYRENSHADVIVTKFLEGSRVLDVDYRPQVKIASLYLDQTPANDTGRALAAKHGVPVYPTVEEALTLGGDGLAVDGVLLIGEHGRYPYNETGQHLYPRRRLFDAAAGVMRRARPGCPLGGTRGGTRAVPLFCDKHLSYSWAHARAMYDAARELRMPLMAGSSIPVTWRKPELELPRGCELEAALAVGYGGTEAYGFHALEGMQCMVERRKGGETGVRRVRCLRGEAVWEAGDRGEWSWELLRAALAVSGRPELATATREALRAKTREPDAFLVEHRDGLRAATLMLYGLTGDFLFAGRLRGQERPAATWFWLQEGKPFGHFARLCQAIERMFLTGKPSYPAERTLLTTGILDAVMHSRAEEGKVRETPELDVRYGA